MTASPQPQASDAAVAIVIVNYRVPKMVKRCLGRLAGEKPQLPKLRVVVVDGGSADGSNEELAAVVSCPEYNEWVSFLPLTVNGGFGWANNQAIQRLMLGSHQPQYIHLLNPDAEIEPGAVAFLVEYLNRHSGVAAVGSQLLEPNGSWTGSAFSFPTVRGEISRGARTRAVDRILRVPPVAILALNATEVDWATGASVMFRADALREVGLFDEGFFLYHEEIELMWRLRQAGWTIAFEPRSRVRHVGGGSTGVHSRETSGRLEPRKPRYWYRSRTRYFALTQGQWAALLAFFGWLLGHAIWWVRRIAGRAPGAKPFDHQLRDHLANGFPRRHDLVHASVPANSPPSTRPAWMENRWL